MLQIKNSLKNNKLFKNKKLKLKRLDKSKVEVNFNRKTAMKFTMKMIYTTAQE